MKRFLVIIMLSFIFISGVKATYVADKSHSVLKKGETIYFDATGLDWQHVYAHIWEKNGETYKDWASNDEMTKVDGTENIYMLTLPDDIDEKYNMIIFHSENGGSSNQTINLGHIEEKFAYLTTGFSDGKRIGYWYLYDKSDLQSRLSSLKSYQLDKDYYTSSSYGNLDDLIVDIEDALSGEIRIEQDTNDASKYYILVDFKFGEADDIIASLKVNTDLLSNLIESEESNYEDYENDYTKNSLDNLKNVIEEQKEVLNGGSVTVNDIKNGINAINNLKDRLVRQADKTNLKKVLDEISKLDKDKYTEESLNNVLNLLDDANDILSDTNVEQDEVDDIVEALKSNIGKLKEKEKIADDIIEAPKTLDDIVKIFGILGGCVVALFIIVLCIKKLRKQS